MFTPILTCLVASLSHCQPAGLPVGGEPGLAVRTESGWRTWWRAAKAPARWSEAHPSLAGAVRWKAAGPGVDWAELKLSGSGEAWRVRVIMTRFDPKYIKLELAYTPDRLNRPDRWSVDDAPRDALFALNGGQFDGHGPWGWTVKDGVELRAPGTGPLAPAVIADAEGRLRFVSPDSIAAVRAAGGVRFALQSYPALLIDDGAVPEPLRSAGMGVNLTHRDARVGLCELRDGRWLVALTRFEGLGGVLESLPFGLTTPEMAAFMGALDCRQAVLLDGGISGQLLIREIQGQTRSWNGLRRVPAGLVATARPR